MDVLVLRYLLNVAVHSFKQGSGAANVGPAQDERFFNKLEDDVSKIIQREKRQEQYSSSPGQEANNSTEHEPVSLTLTHTMSNISTLFFLDVE